MKKDILPIALLTAAIFFGFGFFTNSVHIPPIDEFGHSLLDGISNRWRGPDKIEEGKLLLKNSTSLSYTEKNGEIEEKQIALAVMDTLTGDIFEKRIWIRQDDISSLATRRFEGIELELDRGYSPERPVRAEITWWNSFNSIYRIEPTHYVVVANKYLIPSDIIPGISKDDTSKYSEIIYVPYSKGIHHPQLVIEGEEYLERVVDRAFKELERDEIVSLADPNKLAIESVTKDLVKRIIVTEHMDPDLLAIADDGGKLLAERVYVIIGTNKEIAYYFTSSSADARGIAQFIKSTYDAIVIKYPDTGLIQDFRLGTSTHSNIVKAMVLLFDNNRKFLGNLLNEIDEDEVELALAASYNGNPKWVKESILLYGNDWLEHQDINPILRPETFGYLKKLKSLFNLDFLK